MTGAASSGAERHFRALESLYASAPVNALFDSHLEITGEGAARITFDVTEKVYHAAGAAHGTIYFKMLDDAGFYAANTFVSDRFLLTTSFNLHFTKPVRIGRVVAEGRWVSGRKRVFVDVLEQTTLDQWLARVTGQSIQLDRLLLDIGERGALHTADGAGEAALHDLIR